VTGSQRAVVLVNVGDAGTGQLLSEEETRKRLLINGRFPYGATCHELLRDLASQRRGYMACAVIAGSAAKRWKQYQPAISAPTRPDPRPDL